MKTNFFLVIVVFLLSVTTSCTNVADHSSQFAENEKKYRDSISVLNTQLEEAYDQIDILKYPADQRLNLIEEMFKEEKYDEAKSEIEKLKNVFPNAKENAEAEKYLQKIETIEVAKKAEDERLKSLGFKAFKDNPKVTIDSVTYSYSGFTLGRTFTFEYVYDVNEYSYEVADKNSIFILASLTISTKKDFAFPLSVHACEIVEGKLKDIAYFRTEYASYNTYGARIGNYSETSHDFSKVNSVNYKIAAEIPLTCKNKPIVIIAKKDDKNFSDGLSIEDVQKNYVVIRIINRNKL
jgi:tetratricopeptide (TPR) repeat protein